MVFERVKKVLFVICLAGLVLRWVNLPESMSFFYDQGRDALKASGILSGRFVLVGPTADTSGLFMGPLWYYGLAVLYFVASGNPVVVTQLVSLLDLVAIGLFYLVGQKFFSQKVAMVAAALWAFSAYSVAYARTLANPSTTVFWTLVLVYLLLSSPGQKYLFLLAAVALGIIFQLNPAAGFLLLPAVIFWVYLKVKKHQDIKLLVLSTVVFFSSFLPQVVFEMRHSFISLRSAVTLFAVSESLVNHLGVWLYSVRDYFLPGNLYFSVLYFLVAVVVLFVYRREKLTAKKFFIGWLCLPVIAIVFLYFRSEAHPHYLLTWTPVGVFLLANLIVITWQKSRPWSLLMLVPLLYFNLLGLNKEIFLKDHIGQPADPTKVGLGDQLRTIDLIYQDAKGQMFGYFSYNLLPYWADEYWQYLFSWYGKTKYGYLPIRNGGDLVYIIYEPDPFFGSYFQGPWLAKLVTSKDKELGYFQMGEYRIEKVAKCSGAACL